MRRVYWLSGLALAGVFLSMKDIDWTYDPTGRKAMILAVYGAVGALIGLSLSVAVEPAHTHIRRMVRLLCWMTAFALFGLALGHGNVPWLFTVRVMAISTAIGAVIGMLQFAVSDRRPSARD